MVSYRGMRSWRQFFWMGLTLVVTLVVGVVIGIAVNTSEAEAQGRSFTAGTGMMLNYVNSASTGDFEDVMRKLAEGLQNSENAERNRQADGWKVYRAAEPGPNNSVLYVWFIDPTVQGADYAVANILNEAFPGEVQQLYETFNGSFAGGQAMVNLDLVLEF